MTTTTFKKIEIGQTFEFKSNLNGYDRPVDHRTGQFTKISTRKYARPDGETFRIVGTIETEARLIG